MNIALSLWYELILIQMKRDYDVAIIYSVCHTDEVHSPTFGYDVKHCSIV